MKISRDGVIPQLEPAGRGRKWMLRVGGAKRLFQRSAGVVMQPITMLGAMTSAWATYAPLRDLFLGSTMVYFGGVFALIAVWMAVYYSAILSSEQGWGQSQSQRAERSPLKSDTEEILERVARLDEQSVATDGGDR